VSIRFFWDESSGEEDDVMPDEYDFGFPALLFYVKIAGCFVEGV